MIHAAAVVQARGAVLVEVERFVAAVHGALVLVVQVVWFGGLNWDAEGWPKPGEQ